METVKSLNCIFWHENLLLLLSFKVPLRSSKRILVGTEAWVLTEWKRRQSKFVLIVLLIPYSRMWCQWSITIRFNAFAAVCVFQTESICSLCAGINTISWKPLLVLQYLSGQRQRMPSPRRRCRWLTFQQNLQQTGHLLSKEIQPLAKYRARNHIKHKRWHITHAHTQVAVVIC